MSSLSPHLRAAFADAYRKIRNGELRTLLPFLCLFRLNGKPMSLRMHYQFAPMYSTVQAPHTVWMCGRQLGKSYAVCSSSQLRCALVPAYHTLIVQPRADQIQRLNGTIYQPLMRSCPIMEEFISNPEIAKLALKTFNNGSLVYMEHIFVSPDRLRGASGVATLHIDEAQDIEYEFINVAAETMSASLFWGFSIYTGTPKTTDTTLALLWERSSKAEWVTRCRHCGRFSVPNPEQDLLKMIGKSGPVCAHCGKDISPADGGWVHAIPDRMHSFPGYHLSQTMHPLHSYSQAKWNSLLEKVDHYAQLTLYNEVFGWPYDAATSPLGLNDLVKASHGMRDLDTPEKVRAVSDQYCYLTVGVDWGGGGSISDSYTAYAILGRRAASDIVDVIYGRRLPKDMSPTDEADEILRWIVGVHADAFAYDNGGAGFARLEIMKHQGLMGIPDLTIVPINYVSPCSGDVMRPHAGQREADLYYYSLDKSRSLAINIMAIKACRLRLPPFDETDERAPQRDFLALRENPQKSRSNDTVILIAKKPGVPDDFAHAVNFGCSQIWDHFGAYPRIGTRYDTSVLDFDEDGNRISPDESVGPRGDFDRFAAALDMKVATLTTGGDDYYGF